MTAVWKQNALFRLLAFLDVVGLQPFSVLSDLTGDGEFVDVGRIFSNGSAIHGILSSGLYVFRANITRLFSDEEERAQLLRLVGESAETFSRSVLGPSSLVAFVEVVESDLPVWALLRIKEAFALTGKATTLSEQFLIDALDHWMSQRTVRENDSLVLACGVQPAVLEAARARAEELPHAVEDFIIDVVFPPLTSDDEKQTGKACVLDWLIASYEKCYEAVDVDEEEVEEEASSTESPRKKIRTEAKDGEEFLTAENLDQFMRERPSAVPRAILRERRRSLQDPAITGFELQNHYTANELMDYVKGELGERRRLKKANCVRLILKHHCLARTATIPKEEEEYCLPRQLHEMKWVHSEEPSAM
ncbi:hypothetical protein TraAM80_03608 [Trypanosoma rangeli]|uniref:Uncharacterized protein n=1 Tax=Trypanosoma rangeli TaxID=5698 RepID=A0A3R7MJJ2_TRYRA|nr:uncharacterized protein TraAM80_03608 [Trypanosoma rangeli]RNF06996.1 hypothetical protein TraAM80_03608 [Trypanosoma rangeli]|eukprot:RNF06996.1 hypothetical protein TraAM80_03608 [Trypanosoma rangeli]